MARKDPPSAPLALGPGIQRSKARRERALSALAWRETIYLLDSSTRRGAIPPDDLFAAHLRCRYRRISSSEEHCGDSTEI
ncbi:unnamed protein product, partial [Iphiclides podalirius]